MSNPTLAQRQGALVAALVAGAPPPAGFDTARLDATARALRHKRAGEVAVTWPRLAHALGTRWTERFSRWAHGRPPNGALRDGWDLARDLAAHGTLPDTAAIELAAREAVLRYDGVRPPRRRRVPTVRRIPNGLLIAHRGRVRLLRR